MKVTAAPHKKITRKVVDRYRWKLGNMVRLECGHSTFERGRWVGGEFVMNQAARCWDCEIGVAPASKTAPATKETD